MRKTKRNWLLSLCGALAAFGLITGIWACNPSVGTTANAAGGTPTISMVSGASARKVAGESGIKFTAKIDNYSTDYQYGMLILPEFAWDYVGLEGADNYFTALEDFGIDTYATRICTPYTDAYGNWYISYALKNLQPMNYDLSFLGIAYVYDGENYTFGEVDVLDHSRSMAFVAQTALKYEEKLTNSQRSALKAYTSANISIDTDDYLTDGNLSVGGSANNVTADYAIKYNPNANEAVGFISDIAYAEGTTVSFDYYIPADIDTTELTKSWWGIAWSTSTTVDNYHAAGLSGEGHENYNGHQSCSKTVGAWTTVTATLTSNSADGPYYFYFGSDVGTWKLTDGSDGYILLDNFKLNGELVETFAGATFNESIFTLLDGGRAEYHQLTKPETIFGESGLKGEYAAKLDFTESFNNTATTFMTKTAVAKGGDTISFKYMIPEETTVGDWWSINWHTSNAGNFWGVGNGAVAGDGGISPSSTKGAWTDFSTTLPAGSEAYYLYFCGYGTKTAWNGCVYIDDFKVTRNGETVVEENFNKGVEASIFSSESSYVTSGEGYKAPEVDESLDTMLVFDGAAIGGAEKIAIVTKDTYTGVSEISFKAIWTGEATSARWGLSYTTDPTHTDQYHDTDVNKVYPYLAKFGHLPQDAGVIHQYRLVISGSSYVMYADGTEVSTGSYTEGENYFYFVVAPAVTGGNAFYLEDFSITYSGGTATDTFNGNYSKLFIDSVDINSVWGSDGMSFADTQFIVTEEPENPSESTPQAAKITMDLISTTASTPSFITSSTYTSDGTLTVTFDYYMSGNTIPKWWTFNWTTSPTVANIYAFVEPTDTNNGKELPYSLNIQDSWQTASITIPAGTWYFYFAGAVGEWSGGYVIIDNFKIGDICTETFNYIDAESFDEKTYGIFLDNRSSKPDAITLVEGKEDPKPFEEGEYAAKADFTGYTNYDGTTGKFFISKEAIVQAGDVVTFQYKIPTTTTVGDWWGVCWEPSQNFWLPSGYTSGGLSKTNDGEWHTQTIAITGEASVSYKIYFCIYQNFNGPIYIDDFKVTRGGAVVAEEDFNDEYSNWIFSVNSTYVTNSENGEGYVAGQVAVPSYAAKIYIDKISSTASTPSFITSGTYTSDGTLTVTFDYYMSGNTNSKWWSFAWAESNTYASLYAHTNEYAGCGGSQLPTNVQDSWATATVTIPAGTWYFYFGAARGEWSGGYVIIDNVQIGDICTETFDELTTAENGSDYGIFLDNRNSSNAAAITLVTGKENPVPSTPFEPGEHAAEWDVDGNVNEYIPLLSKEAYAGGSTIYFKYYIDSASVADSNWWGLAYSTSNSGLSIYDAAGSNKFNISKTAGEWVEQTFTLPAGGPYYIYFGACVGGWNGNIFIDDFQVISSTGIVTEDFNQDPNEWIFTLGEECITYGEGTPAIEQVGDDIAAQINVDKFTGANLGEFITKQAFEVGSVVEFDYFIPSNVTPTWWRVSVTANPLDAGVYSHHDTGITCGNVTGAWTHVRIELTTAGYIYFAGAIGEWNGGCVYIDNFKVTLGGEVVAFEDFNYGVDGGLFIVNNTNGAIVNYDGASLLGANSDPYALENLLQDSAMLEDVLENGGYASITSDVEVDATNLPASTLLFEGTFDYTITGEKEFAIYFGNNYYIYVNGTKIALYNGTSRVKEITGGASGKLYISLTPNGELAKGMGIEKGCRVYVKLDGGAYIGLGEMESNATGMKLVALGGDGNVSFENFAIETYKCNYVLEDVPVYFSEEQIEFIAYAFDGPAGGSTVTDAGFQQLVDAGFTTVLALAEGRVSGLGGMYNGSEGEIIGSGSTEEIDRLMTEVNKDALVALALAEKYGVDYYVFNEALYGMYRNDQFYVNNMNDIAEQASYLLSSAFAGHYFADEPAYGSSWSSSDNYGYGYNFDTSKSELDELVTAYRAYKAAFPDSEVYINLLPYETIKTTGSTRKQVYQGYVDYYVENIAKDVGNVKGTGYVSIDIYPLQADGNMIDGHLWCLEYIAGVCEANDLDFRLIIKGSHEDDPSNGFNKRETESINDLRLQIYSGLAYGVKDFGYFQYAQTDPNSTIGSLINGATLEAYDAYDWAKQVNNEVHMFEKAYLNFAWDSASILNSCTQFDKLEHEVSIGSHGVLSSVTSTAKVLIGNFTDKDDDYMYGAENAYVVVNYGDSKDQSTVSDVTLTFNGKNRALVYNEGNVEVVTLTNNQLTLSMNIGEGAFIIPLN